MSKEDEVLDQFYRLDTVWERVRSALPEDLVSDVFIGGGAVRDFFFGFDPKDYDVFLVFKNPTAKALDLATMYLYDAFENPQNEVQFEAVKDALNNDTLCDYTIKLLDSEIEGDAVQFLFKNDVKGVQSLIERFDLDICQFGYDGEELYTGSDVDLESVKRALCGKGPVRLLNPCSTYARLLRFRERYGCDVQQAANDLRDAVAKDGTPHKFIGTPMTDKNWIYWRSMHSNIEAPIADKENGDVDLDGIQDLLDFDIGSEFDGIVSTSNDAEVSNDEDDLGDLSSLWRSAPDVSHLF